MVAVKLTRWTFLLRINDIVFRRSLCKQVKPRVLLSLPVVIHYLVVWLPSSVKVMILWSLAKVYFCLVSFFLFILLQSLIIYPCFHYPCCRGFDNILVIMIDGILSY
ncbi:transmembrane protein, putative [Rhizoctonia solani AG-3 Rhs1AP]|uniref:Transmembrane protein, putative n=1 Tax=Rhizoctonia solani AG-3 Rhs1AP TaxID=1086054 RepID=A0A0A1UHT6_9AGAM|nr:transmembrane protein, putative [Rhizoctonia solani AG-3 Rhs1AP]